jgi:hypothetical protein
MGQDAAFLNRLLSFMKAFQNHQAGLLFFQGTDIHEIGERLSSFCDLNGLALFPDASNQFRGVTPEFGNALGFDHEKTMTRGV